MLEQLLKNLNSRRKAVREAALAEARALPPDQLLQLADLEAQNYKRRMRIYNRIAWVYAIVAIGGAACAWWSLGTHHPFFGNNFAAYSYWPFYLLTFALLPRQARRNVATIIEQTQDPRFVGPALTLLAEKPTSRADLEVKKSAMVALKNLLPQLRADQAAALTAEQRHALLIPLRPLAGANSKITVTGKGVGLRPSKSPYDDIDLTLSILKALEQVGDEKAIPIVEKLTESDATPQMRIVKEAAEECLQFLEINVERAHQSQTLLRASDATNLIASETLLRPVIVQPDATPPEQLLRPSDQTSHSGLDRRVSPGIVQQEETPQQQLLRPSQE